MSASPVKRRKGQRPAGKARKSKPKSKPATQSASKPKAIASSVPLRNRELSWLSFNARILQEASDPSVPLLERVRFLGIFSNNLDEFFRIRVAGLRRLADLGDEAEAILGGSPDAVLKEIRKVVLKQHKHFDRVFSEITAELDREQIHIISEKELDEEQSEFVRSYFRTRIRKHIIPLMLDQIKTLPALRDQSTYLAVELSPGSDGRGRRYALMEVPTEAEGRFLQLPPRDDGKYIMLLDDVIRFCLRDIFSVFGFEHYSAWAVKITKDGELEIEEDLSQSMVKKLARSLRLRHEGNPVRFTYDSDLPRSFLKLLSKKLKVTAEDTVIPGQRYLNSRDFIQFPDLGPSRMRYRPQRPMLHPALQENGPLLATMAHQDVLVHYPYHSFDHVNDLLRECSIDPHVTSIKLTIYRAARNSSVINALINAARNGKTVTVVLELQARFDEEANLFWGKRLQEEGVHVIYGVPGLKVHAKLCLITRIEHQRKVRYAVVGTGNFNEDTARLYGDHALFTSDVRITKEVRRVFRFCESNYSLATFRHLWVSPFNARQKLRKFIRAETRVAAAGGEAYIRMKLNNLTDPDVIKDLYAASQAGVRVELLIRSMFSLIPGMEGVSEGIRAMSIVDRYLEHSRIFIFGNKGKPACFISSADCMPRNLDRRVEVICPIYDKDLQGELETYFDLQWRDTAKTRILDVTMNNRRPRAEESSSSRSQYAIYRWLRRQARDIALHEESVAADLTPNTT